MTRRQLFRLCNCILMVWTLLAACFYTGIDGTKELFCGGVCEEETLSGTQMISGADLVLMREKSLRMGELSVLSGSRQESVSCQRRSPIISGFTLPAVLPQVFKQFWSTYRKCGERNMLRSMLLVWFLCRSDGKKAALALHIK
ncbi:MAG: hypothetical protein ACI4AD_01150 [Roseburia sp.]